MSKISILNVKPIMLDDELVNKEGNFFDVSHYNRIIKTNYDIYGLLEDGTKKLLLKFRKNVIPDNICNTAFTALEKHAKHKNYNRGAAAGVLNIKKLPAYIGKITKKDKFRIYYNTHTGKKTNDNVGNMAMSNIAGYYDKPDRNAYLKIQSKLTKHNNKNSNKHNNKSKNKHKYNFNTNTNPNTNNKFTIKNNKRGYDKFGIPLCRTTQFTTNETQKWHDVLPLIHHADKQFKTLIPDRHKIQLERAQLTPKFQIDNTAYSTITLNYDWRTACHKDSGDFEEGFGNLIVLEKQLNEIHEKHEKSSNKISDKRFTGSYIGFPKWGICVDVRQGDFLAMDVHEWHCNTALKGSGRLSIVCYLRKNMIKCK